MNRRDLLIAPAALAFTAGADAQIDSAPVRILVGAPAGGSPDTLPPAPAALASPAGSDAQTDSAPVLLLVGAPAGGSTDTLARALAASMGTALGRAVIVENKPGAGGNIAAEAI